MEVSLFLPLSDGLHLERVTTPATKLLVHVVSSSPKAYVNERTTMTSTMYLVHVVSSSPKAYCSLGGVQASRIHSRYTRRVVDLPCVDQHVTSSFLRQMPSAFSDLPLRQLPNLRLHIPRLDANLGIDTHSPFEVRHCGLRTTRAMQQVGKVAVEGSLAMAVTL